MRSGEQFINLKTLTMERSAKAAYESYVQIWNESKVEVLYDEDERPMMIRTKDIGDPLSWDDWLVGEMELAIDEEEYMYAAQIRDELKLLENENRKHRKTKRMDAAW
jgi:hypothetical protein